MSDIDPEFGDYELDYPDEYAEREAMPDTAAERLHSIIVRTRFRCPGTSSDPYMDALVLWVSVVGEVRDILASLEVPSTALSETEFIYRDATEAWLSAASLSDADQVDVDDRIISRLRDALSPNVWDDE